MTALSARLKPFRFLALPLFFLALVFLDYSFRFVYAFTGPTRLLALWPMLFTGGWALLLTSLTALLPRLFTKTNIHAGLFFAIAAVIFGHILLEKSSFGYRIKMVGTNPSFAKYSGINVTATIIICELIGGFLAGFGGAVEQLGMYKRFEYQGLSGHGFDGVMIAVIAGNNPKYIPLAALFLAYVRVGAEATARMSDVPPELVLSLIHISEPTRL